MDAVPLSIVATLLATLSGVIVYLSKKLDTVRTECDTKCTTQLTEKNKTIADMKVEHDREVEALKVERDGYRSELAEFRERLIKEIQHGVNLAMLPRRPNESPPDSLPPPEWEESPEMEQMREQVQAPALAQRRREYEASSSNMKAVASPEVLRRGMRKHPMVARVQTFLQSLNLYRDPIDGDFSVETEAAVKHFQDVAHVPVTGIIDTQTWGALFQAGFQMPEPMIRKRTPSRPR